MSLTPEEFAELGRLFDKASQLDGPAQEEFLRAARKNFPAIADRLGAMLRQDQPGEQDLENIIANAAKSLPDTGDPFLGRQFGPYRAERLLGRGGMGAVYLGIRIDGEFEQTAAIKTIRYGLESPELVERFQRERAILAQLNHGGIARLLDGGSGPGGIPFVAMEFVDGTPLTRYAEEHRCDLKRRLGLFAELCDAVAFVHRNLVIHRDIKPSNVLVTAEGHVKLLDFGIAKLTDSFGVDAAVTQTQSGAMTPEYASPEQILHLPATTAVDVYGLGVLLYELLTGRRPIRLDSRNPYALAQAIVEQVPSIPSDVVGTPVSPEEGSTPSASVPPSHWKRKLRGDLDRIVMMALRKEPERRYSSVAALAADVRAYLDGKPVAAQEDSWHYRARRFVGRHPWATAAGCVFLLTVSSFTWFTQQQSVQVRQQRDRALEAESRANATADFLSNVFTTADPRVGAARNMTALDLVDQGLANLEQDNSLDPAAKIELHMILGFTLTNLDRFEDGSRSMQHAIDLSDAEYGRDSLQAAETRHRLGDVYRRMERYDDAYRLLNEALEIRSRLIDGADVDIADSYNNLGILVMAMGRWEEAERLQLASVEMHAVLGDSHSVSVNNLALVKRRQGRFDESIALSERALEMLGDSDPGSRFWMMTTRKNSFMEMGRIADAERATAELKRIVSDLYDSDHTRALGLDRGIGVLQRLRGNFDLAESTFAVLAPRIKTTKGPESTPYASLLLEWGTLDRDRGLLARSEEKLREAERILKAARTEQNFEQPRIRMELATTLNARGKLKEAEVWARQAMDAYPPGERYPHLGRAISERVLAENLRAQRRFAESQELIDSARAIVDVTAGGDSPFSGEIYVAQAQLNRDRGDRVPALEALHQAEKIFASSLPERHPIRLRFAAVADTF